jgi:hypothetical protein
LDKTAITALSYSLRARVEVIGKSISERNTEYFRRRKRNDFKRNGSKN